MSEIAYWTIVLKNLDFLVVPVFFKPMVEENGKAIRPSESIIEISERTKSTVVVVESIIYKDDWYIDSQGVICIEKESIAKKIVEYIENFILDVEGKKLL